MSVSEEIMKLLVEIEAEDIGEILDGYIYYTTALTKKEALGKSNPSSKMRLRPRIPSRVYKRFSQALKSTRLNIGQILPWANRVVGMF